MLSSSLAAENRFGRKFPAVDNKLLAVKRVLISCLSYHDGVDAEGAAEKEWLHCDMAGEESN